MLRGRRWMIGMVATALAACGGDSGPKFGDPAALTIVAGHGNTATVGTLMPTLSVRAADDAGRSVPSKAVTWAVTQGGGSVSAVSAVTDDGGLAHAQWTLGTKAGTHSVTATVAGKAGVPVTASFLATGTPGPTSRLEKLSGDNQTGGAGAALPAQLALKVSDQYGNGVPNVTVSWTVNSGGGQCGGTSTSDSEGTARATWTMGPTTGSARVTASVSGVTAVSFDATVSAGAVATVAVTPASGSVSPGAQLLLTATLRDAYGNIATGRTVSWSSSNPSVATVSTTGMVTGVAAGSATITASAEGKSGTATVTVAAPFTLSVQNLLIDSVRIFLNGSFIGTADAAATTTWTGAKPSSVSLSWQLVQRRTSTGVSLGDGISAIFGTDYAPTANESYTIDNVIDTDWYFAPLMDNRTAARLLMAVNWGLTTENRCNCVVPAFTSNVAIGYYHLYTTTIVRAYADGSGYTGGYVYWQNFSSYIGMGSGSYILWTILTPTSIAPVAGESSRFDLRTALAAVGRTDRPVAPGGIVPAGPRPLLVRTGVRPLAPAVRFTSPISR